MGWLDRVHRRLHRRSGHPEAGEGRGRRGEELPELPHRGAAQEGRGAERAQRRRQVARRGEGQARRRQSRRRLAEGLPGQEVMRRIAAAAGVAVLWAAAALGAGPSDFGVPPPHGWIGTTDDWMRGIGLVLAVLDVALILFLWGMVRRRGLTAASKTLILGAIVVLPAIVVFLATAHGMSESMTVNACGDCHAMDSHVADLRNPASDSLAAVHYKNRYIQNDQCYTCHSDYGMFGTMTAKLEGLGHVYHNMTGNYPKPIKIRNPYSNLRCLSCHGGAANFLAKHDKEMLPNLLADKDKCLDCHGPAHKAEEAAVPEKQALR